MPTTVIHINKAPANWRSDSHYVYIGRGYGSIWGNEFSWLEGTLAGFKVANRAESIAAHKQWITEGGGRHLLQHLHLIRNKILVCFCCPKDCHGDTLVELCDGKPARLVQESLF